MSQLPSTPISTSARGTGLDRVSCRRCHCLFKCIYGEGIEKDVRFDKHRITENSIFREFTVMLAGDEHLFSVFDMLNLSCVAHICLSLVILYLDRVSAYTHRTMNMKISLFLSMIHPCSFRLLILQSFSLFLLF